MGLVKFYGGKALVTTIQISDFASLVATDTITIGGRIYEFGAATPGRVQVAIGGSDAATIANFIAAFNLNKPTVPCTAYIDATNTDYCHVIADSAGAAGNLTSVEAMTGGTNIISHTTGVLGVNNQKQVMSMGRYVVTAVDATGLSLVIPTGLTSIAGFLADVRAVAGCAVAVPITDNITGVGGANLVITTAGATHITAGMLISWIAWES